MVLAFEDPALIDVEDYLIEDHYLPGEDCHAVQMAFSHDTMHASPFFYDYADYMDVAEAFLQFSKEDRLTLAKVHRNEIRLVPMGRLQKAIKTSLAMPKTVFLSPLDHFESDWELFRKEMRVNKALKFSRYLDKEGTPLRTVKTYGFTKGLHDPHRDLVPRRLKTIVSNGMLGLWRKWADMRLKFRQSRNVAAVIQKQDFMPLSLCGSDIYFVFVLFGFCLLTCWATLLLEFCFLFRTKCRSVSAKGEVQ